MDGRTCKLSVEFVLKSPEGCLPLFLRYKKGSPLGHYFVSFILFPLPVLEVPHPH